MIERRPFGLTKSGVQIESYILSNGNGMLVEILNFGGILRRLCVPTVEGIRDVVLGFDSVSAYESQDKYIGALIGRVANRIGGAAFSMNGRSYRLSANDGTNSLHGGKDGYHTKVWAARGADGTLVLSCFSPDGETGFPGNLDVEARYTLTDDNALKIEFFAVCDGDTIVSLTNHNYFNLGGHSAGGIEAHTLQIFADGVTEIDKECIPTGRIMAVGGTPFDFRDPKAIGPGLRSAHPQIVLGAGYDHNFVLGRSNDRVMRSAAAVEAGGLRMECLTTQPGLQLYTSNYLSGERGKAGAPYAPRCALCLETQSWPDAVNHPHFPDCFLRKGQAYRQATIYRFSAAKSTESREAPSGIRHQ